MSTSVIERRRMARAGLVYLGTTIFCTLFGAAYESFSHGVYSYFMRYAFAFPLCAGALPCFVLAYGGRRIPSAAAARRYHAGIAAWTVGSMVQGALEIYGTSNRLTQIYWYMGAAWMVSALIPWRVLFRRHTQST